MNRIKAFIAMLLMIAFVALAAIASGQTPQDSISVNLKIKNPCKSDTIKITWSGGTIKIPMNIPCADTLFRGMYVNGFNSIVGNFTKEAALISDLNKLKITHISCYSISTTSNPTGLAALINRIKLETGVKTISPAISSTSGINSWAAWNSSHSSEYDVDELTLEYEAYNQSNVATAWATNCTYFQQMYTLQKNGTIVGMNDYMGWWTKEPMKTQTPDTIVRYFSININTLFLHDYRTSPDFNYMVSRLDGLNASGVEAGKILRWKALFSFEPSFLQPWLQQGHTVDEAFWIIYNAFKAKKYSNLILDGWMGFHLDYWRASQPVQAFMGARSIQAPKINFSENNFKNKTSRRSKRLIKHDADNGYPLMPYVPDDSIPLPVK